MRKIILGLVVGALSASSWSACTYNFDATTTEIQQMNPNSNPPAKKFTYLNGTSGGFLLENSSYQYLASTSSFSQSLKNYNSGTSTSLVGDKNLNSSGKYAVELKINNFADIPTGSYSGTHSGVFTLGYNFYGVKNGALKYAGFVWVVNSDDTKTKTVFVSVADLASGHYGKQFDIGYNTANNYKVGLYIDQDSKQIGVNLNGIDKGFVNDTPLSSIADQVSFQMAGLSGGYPTSLTGTYQPIETLIFDGSQMSLNYSSGTKDICGNTI